jgi:hypothetical protein
MKYFVALVLHQIQVLDKVAASVYGSALAALCGLAAFFAPEKYAFIVVYAAIVADGFFGVWVATHKDQFILSKLGRATVLKFISYSAALILLYMVEHLAHGGAFIGVRVAAAWAAACEFWSMSASILILWPDATFFKMLRNQLRGEIAAKLGQDPEEIKDPK